MDLDIIYSAIFYLLGLIVLAATLLAVTRRNMVHTVVYLAVSFLGLAVLFFLLGAPLLAALEVIVYAGAIMVLFLFIVLSLRPLPSQESDDPPPDRPLGRRRAGRDFPFYASSFWPGPIRTMPLR